MPLILHTTLTAPVRALIVRRPAPAAYALAPVVPVPVAAALGAQPGRDPLPAPGGQVVPVRLPLGLRLPVTVPGAGVLQAPPAAGAVFPVGPVSVGAALHAQPGLAVPGASTAGHARPHGGAGSARSASGRRGPGPGRIRGTARPRGNAHGRQAYRPAGGAGQGS